MHHHMATHMETAAAASLLALTRSVVARECLVQVSLAVELIALHAHVEIGI